MGNTCPSGHHCWGPASVLSDNLVKKLIAQRVVKYYANTYRNVLYNVGTTNKQSKKYKKHHLQTMKLK
jgi:hypothetical protein